MSCMSLKPKRSSIAANLSVKKWNMRETFKCKSNAARKKKKDLVAGL